MKGHSELCKMFVSQKAFPLCLCLDCVNDSVEDKNGKSCCKGRCPTITCKRYKKEDEGVSEIKDSGERTKFETGAVRDIQEGKGRCDLLPLDVVAGLLRDEQPQTLVLDNIACFQETGEEKALLAAISEMAKAASWTMEQAILQVSIHYEKGANKYGANNWKKGIPVHSYIDSAIRHYLKWLDGYTDEPHTEACIWNLMCCVWTLTHKPELDDYTWKIPAK